MNATWLIQWWNLVFLLPFGLALLYLGLYTASGITFGDGDFDHDLDADHDFDADHDLDSDHDAASDHGADSDHDADHDADSDQDAQGDHGSHAAPHLAVLTWLGVGRVPVSIMLTVLLLTWGTAGFITNAALESRGAAAAFVSIPVAIAVSALLTHFVAAAMGRYLPLYETTARRRHALLGSFGQAIFPINEKFGMASVRDATGDLYQIPCRVEAPAESIPKGAGVQLVAYNARQGLFYVTRRDAPAPAVNA